MDQFQAPRYQGTPHLQYIPILHQKTIIDSSFPFTIESALKTEVAFYLSKIAKFLSLITHKDLARLKD